MDRRIRDFLIEIGIAPNLIGFEYIAQAVEIILADCDSRPKMMFVYEKIASINNVKFATVERNIRHAISKINTKNESYMKHIGKPILRNSEMLYLVAYRVKKGEI